METQHLQLLPQAVDIEETILGLLMGNELSFLNVISLITPEMFYKQQNQIIAKTIWELHKNNKPIDMLTVASFLKKNKESISNYELVQICNKAIAINIIHIKEYALIVKEKYLLRKWIEIAEKGTRMAYNEETEVLEFGLSEFEKLYNGTERQMNFVELVSEAKKNFTEAIENGYVYEMKTGIHGYDKHKFLEKGSLNIIAARPGVGKTAFSLEICKRISVKKQVGFISLELTEQQLIRRLARGEMSEQTTSCFDNYKVTGKALEEIYKAFDTVGDFNLHINDKSGLNVEQIKAQSKFMKMKYNISLLVIDYLQLIRKNIKMTTNDAIGEITLGLKNLAKELDIPIILLSQLSRKVEDRGGMKIPNLSHLRDSGNIEQDADSVVFLWRPEYYKIPNIEWNGKEVEGHGKTLLVIGKHREGSISDWSLLTNNENLTKYADYVDSEIYESEKSDAAMHPSSEIPF